MLSGLLTCLSIYLQEVPRVEIPLHTLMELTPKADGTIAETRFHVDVDRALAEVGWVDLEGSVSGKGYLSSEVTTDEECGQLEIGRRVSKDAKTSVATDRQSHDGDLQPSSVEPSGGSFRRSISMAELAAAELVIAREMLGSQPE